MTQSFLMQKLLSLLVSVPGLLLCLSLHEAAHGYTAYRLGDPTAKNAGRLTLDPLKHLDPVGTICLLFFHVGWAKPVPVNTRYFKNPRRDTALVSLAGALLSQQQRYADLNCGNGMLVMGLASVIIGQALTGRRGVVCGLIAAAGGSLIYRVVLQLAYKVNMPSYAFKLLSALIVVLALSMPLIQKKLASLRKGGAQP